jgi:hypothetical protein
MKTLKVRKAGLLIPKRFLKDASEAIISEENGKIIITPILKHDPIQNLGKKPIRLGIRDASINLDNYLYDGK